MCCRCVSVRPSVRGDGDFLWLWKVWHFSKDSWKLTKPPALSVYVIFSGAWKLKEFQTAKVIFTVTLKVTGMVHSIGHIRFPISLPLQLCLYLAPFMRSLSSHVTWTCPLGSNLSCVQQQYSNVSISTRNVTFLPSPIPKI